MKLRNMKNDMSLKAFDALTYKYFIYMYKIYCALPVQYRYVHKNVHFNCANIYCQLVAGLSVFFFCTIYIRD